MKAAFLVAMIAMVMMLAGCQTPDPASMNVQRAILYGGGAALTGPALDAVDDADIEAVHAETIVVCKDILKFLDSGKVADLPMDQVEAELKKLLDKAGHPELAFIVNAALAAVATQSVDLDKAIGAKNVERIEVVVMGVLYDAEHLYLVKDRP